jgi:hypothetical protein
VFIGWKRAMETCVPKSRSMRPALRCREVKEFSLPFADLAIRQNEIRTASFGLTPRFYVNPREVVH